MDQQKQRTDVLKAQSLTDDDMAAASGGVGYSSIECKKCGKTFANMDAYRAHIIEAHTLKTGVKKNV